MYTAISQKQTRRKKPNDSISRLSADIATNQATKDAGNNNYICIGFPSISLEANSKPYMFICIDINGDL